MPGVQLPWNDEMLAELLHCVIVKGAHLSSKAANWIAVNTMFFEQDLLRPYKAEHYKDPAKYRKIKDKADKIIEKIKAEKDSGRVNTSGLSGDLNELYKNAEQIIAEKERADEINAFKASEKALKKRKLDENVEAVLKPPVQGHGARKHLHGDITGANKSSKVGVSTAEERIWQYLEKDGNEEEHVEEAMIEWVGNEGKTEEDLATEAKVDESDRIELVRIEMDILLSIYCSPGSKFNATVFKTALEQQNLSSMGCHRIFSTLQKWRRLAMKKKASPVVPPTNSATSLSNSNPAISVTSIIVSASPAEIVIDGPAAAEDIQQEQLSEDEND